MAWTPEIAVDRELARRLIGSQFPELELRSLELIGEGWDNTVWLVDGEWAFRFPRRAIAVPLVQRELAVLPRHRPTAQRARARCPSSAESRRDAFPWPYLGARFIPGEELGRVPADEIGARTGPRRVPRGASRSSNRTPNYLSIRTGAWTWRDESPMARDASQRSERLGLWSPPAARGRALRRGRGALAPPERLVTAHGDLHFRHVLVDERRRARRRDRLGRRVRGGSRRSTSCSTGAPSRREAGRRSSTPTGRCADDDLVRARVLALGINAILAEYGHREGRTSVRDEALASLARTIVD